MAKEGLGQAIEVAAEYADGEYVQKVADEIYNRINKAEDDIIPSIISAIINLKEHDLFERVKDLLV